jgi:hypothetical protein
MFLPEILKGGDLLGDLGLDEPISFKINPRGNRL